MINKTCENNKNRRAPLELMRLVTIHDSFGGDNHSFAHLTILWVAKCGRSCAFGHNLTVALTTKKKRKQR